MARILTGIQSSGRPHLGNILGAIKPAIELSKLPGNKSFFFIADLHSLTTLRNGENRRMYTQHVAATWLAFGLDTKRSIFWRQSKVRCHTELAWYLDCFTPMAMLENATSFKDKSKSISDSEIDGTMVSPVSAGLFTYPVLQAADILLYEAEIVPVGKDQKQHIEITRDIARSFNHYYSEPIFVEPEARIDSTLMTIPGIDGRKMSKSYNNQIDIFMDDNELWKVIKKIKSGSTSFEDPKNSDSDITFQLYSLLASDEQTTALRSLYNGGNYGYGDAKKALYELITERFSSERSIFNFYMKENPSALEAELQRGERRARAIAGRTIRRVREKLGFN